MCNTEKTHIIHLKKKKHVIHILHVVFNKNRITSSQKPSPVCQHPSQHKQN